MRSVRCSWSRRVRGRSEGCIRGRLDDASPRKISPHAKDDALANSNHALLEVPERSDREEDRGDDDSARQPLGSIRLILLEQQDAKVDGNKLLGQGQDDGEEKLGRLVRQLGYGECTESSRQATSTRTYRKATDGEEDSSRMSRQGGHANDPGREQPAVINDAPKAGIVERLARELVRP